MIFHLTESFCQISFGMDEKIATFKAEILQLCAYPESQSDFRFEFENRIVFFS